MWLYVFLCDPPSCSNGALAELVERGNVKSCVIMTAAVVGSGNCFVMVGRVSRSRRDAKRLATNTAAYHKMPRNLNFPSPTSSKRGLDPPQPGLNSSLKLKLILKPSSPA